MASKKKPVDQNKGLKEILKEFKKLPKAIDMIAKHATDNTCECKQLVIANVQLASINTGIRDMTRAVRTAFSRNNTTPPGQNQNQPALPTPPTAAADDTASLLSKMDAQLRQEHGDPFARMTNPFPDPSDPNYQGPPVSPQMRAEAQAYVDLANAATDLKERFFGVAASLTSLSQTVMGILRDFEGVRMRAYASNSTVAQNITPESMAAVSDLGVSLKDLTLEVIKLREVGFTELKGSTMKLIARMKLSDQNTGSLSNYLVRTSAALGRSEAETQDMAVQLDKTARSFGRRTDDLMNFAASLKDSLKILSFGDKSQGMKFEKAATGLESMTGGKASKEIERFMAMIGDSDNLMKFQAAGLGDPLARMQAAKTDSEATETLKSIVREMQQFGIARGATGAGSGGMTGQMQAKAAMGPVGFDTVLLANTISNALQEPQEQSPLLESMENLKSIMNRFMAPLERLVNVMFEVINYLSPALEILASVAGNILALTAAIVSLQGVMKLVEFATLALRSELFRDMRARMAGSMSSALGSARNVAQNVWQRGFFTSIAGGFTRMFTSIRTVFSSGFLNVAQLVGRGLGTLLRGILGPLGLIITFITVIWEVIQWIKNWWTGDSEENENLKKIVDNTDPKNDPSYKRLNESIGGNVNDILKNIINSGANQERLEEMRKQTAMLATLNSNLNTQGKAPQLSQRLQR